MSKKNRFSTFLVAGILSLSSILGAGHTLPQAQAAVASATYQAYTYGGVTSHYHVYATGIDWSQPVGVLFFFDGDYPTPDLSRVHFPQHASLTSLAAEANSRNMVFVPVISPDKNASGHGITWWENMDFNGDWFRSFAQHFIAQSGINPAQVWTLGHSGGAEFQTFELGADRTSAWRRGGGNVIVGGGGFNTTSPALLGSLYRADPATKAMPWNWYVGALDGLNQGGTYGWSAKEAAYRGRETYRTHGFTNTSLHELPGIHHYNYDFTRYLAESYQRAGVQKKFTVNQGIAAYYYANNRAALYGAPTSPEFKLRGAGGGVAQNFSRDASIYWTPNFGAHGVLFGSAIGAKYRADGYENHYGYPATDEYPVQYGGAAHQFQRLDNGKRYYIYWSPSTGAHSIYRDGAIGARFEREGWELRWGFPVSDEERHWEGSRQFFLNTATKQRTAVYWSAQYGARTLNPDGVLFRAWAGSGDYRGWGRLVTDEEPLGRSGAALMLEAENGQRTYAVWSQEAGVQVLKGNGAIYWKYRAEGVAKLGYPLTGEYEDRGRARQDFSNGYSILWTAQTGAQLVETSSLS